MAKVICKTDHRIETESTFQPMIETRLKFNTLLDSVSFKIISHEAPFQIFGMELLDGRPGIIYDVMGVNGIGYETFNRMVDYIPFVKALHPDGIILSLGTNDAYVPQVDSAEFKKHIVAVVHSIHESFPHACIILTTPGDHLVRKKMLNPNLIKINETILSVAKREQCVVWDFFAVMGGLGSSIRWEKKGLMYKDMLHLTQEGYHYQGTLFYQALTKTLENGRNNP